MKIYLFCLYFFGLLLSQFVFAQEVTGELKKWHKVTLNFEGPNTSENAENNPFLNYRLTVTFTHNKSGKEYKVPGYYATDGDAANSNADSGNVWKVHFSPDQVGEWNYSVEFVLGKWAAIRNFNKLKSAGYMDGQSGSFNIKESDKVGNDFRGKGRLQYVGERYLKFAETGEYFLKCGPDAPENFLAYYAFDGSFHNDGHKDELVKTWAAHKKDWNDGDPYWQDGKGKEIIGAMNYLASEGLNAVSFLTLNIEGDDRNVFPYINYNTWDRFDCSKLDQWEILFEHADKIGLFLHFKSMEYENQGLLDNGGIGLYTKLYYRELIARFGHHLALNWNLGEETGDWTDNPPTFPLDDDERLLLAKYISELDPYNHHLVIHNGVWFDGIYGPNSKFTGASLQTGMEDFSHVHSKVLQILNESEKAGKIWAVACDEPGDHKHSLIPDSEDPTHDNARKNGLWGAFMAGGWGTEWYFGYEHAHSDLTCQDYRSRDLFWDQCRYALEFFRTNSIPFWEMASSDNLISNKNDYCLANPGEIYMLYLKNGGTVELDLKNNDNKYEIMWFNPRKGGKTLLSEKKVIEGGGKQNIGKPPYDDQFDWVVIVKKTD